MTTFRTGAAAAAAGLLTLVCAGGPALADGHTQNHEAWWEAWLVDQGYTGVDCDKIDGYDQDSYTADQDYLLVVLKAGSDQSTGGAAYDQYMSVSAGTSLEHATGKTISFVITCTGEEEVPTTEPPEPTTEPPVPTTEPPVPTTEPPVPATEPPGPTHPGQPTQPPGSTQPPIGPVVQTDVPDQGLSPVVPLGLLAAAGLGLAAVGLRRRTSEH